ncbi:hypothetical protein PFISCL1PPCAC_13536, partial [Pristionchus fissidentatus]
SASNSAPSPVPRPAARALVTPSALPLAQRRFNSRSSRSPFKLSRNHSALLHVLLSVHPPARRPHASLHASSSARPPAKATASPRTTVRRSRCRCPSSSRVNPRATTPACPLARRTCPRPVSAPPSARANAPQLVEESRQSQHNPPIR